MYLGPPDFLRVDQGSSFVSKEFQSAAELDGITVLQAPVETPETMSHAERYHGPLRSAYKKLEPSESASDLLQAAVKCVNDTVGPEGLCPTLLVFGALPKPARQAPSPTHLQRAAAIDNAMREVQKVQVEDELLLDYSTEARMATKSLS